MTMPVKVVFFKSKSCPVCHTVEPVYKTVLESFDALVEAAIVDIADDMQAAVDNGVLAVPTIIVYRDGKETQRMIGQITAGKMGQALKEALKK
jgi:thioredoxin 1